MNFFAYLFAGLGEPLIGGIMDTNKETSLVFVIVAAASAASAVVAFLLKR